MKNKMNLEEFKANLKSDSKFREQFADSDFVDFNTGTATIHRSNINKYLEEYICKSEEDLVDTLWYAYGVFAHIVD